MLETRNASKSGICLSTVTLCDLLSSHCSWLPTVAVILNPFARRILTISEYFSEGNFLGKSQGLFAAVVIRAGGFNTAPEVHCMNKCIQYSVLPWRQSQIFSRF